VLPTTAAPSRRRASGPTRLQPRISRRPQRRGRRIAALAALLALLPAAVSYLGVVLQTSNTSLGIRTVEWLRDHGARSIVNQVESIYYSANGPSTGGPALHRLPSLAGGATAGAGRLGTAHAARSASAAHYRPPPISPLIRPALPNEGVWRATYSGGTSAPPVLVSSFRSDPAYPQMVAGVAWIDHTLTNTWLYPGRSEPAVTMGSRGPMEIPTHLRRRVVAAFNSGFKLADSGGGFASGGRTYARMKPGLATILRYRDGSLDVRAWNGGSSVGSNVIYARQNLPLIVSGGRPNPHLSDGPEWGTTLGNAIRVWRSAVGVDSHGNLIYGAADNQTVGSLAQIMIRARAVRAMELDINSYWPSFITYRQPGAVGAANLLPGMTRSTQRYLTPDDRDFFGVYLR
jgi:hypothetical protein